MPAADTKHPHAPALGAELRASRSHLEHITRGLDGDRLLGPKLDIVNPPLWELGHVAWFQEYWCLRQLGPGRVADSILPNADALYDSAKVAHATRWDLPLPDLNATRAYQREVLERVTRRLERETDNGDLRYYAQLALFHEDMHAEAFHYTRQTLGYESPLPARVPGPGALGHGTKDVLFEGGPFLLGAPRGDSFVFDNEKWAHEVTLAPFRISRTPVTNEEYADFVDSRGYERREWWDEDGWAWRSRVGLVAPVYWKKQDGEWMQRQFDQAFELRAADPVLHVSWHEAQAWCRYARRRLPTEAEWEFAASWNDGAPGKRHFPWGQEPPAPDLANLEGAGVAPVEEYPAGDSAAGCRQMIGNAWEWTSSTFQPFPGYVVDPYREYSQPWFGTHKVLRGGSFATTRRLIRNTWRNFFTPGRNDIFAGFRTCALDDADERR